VIKRENERMSEQFENDQFLQEVIFQETGNSKKNVKIKDILRSLCTYKYSQGFGFLAADIYCWYTMCT